MGLSGYISECCNSNDLIVKSIHPSVFPIKEVKIQETEGQTRETTTHYNGFTKDELDTINEKVNINFDKYKIPVKSSDINYLYQSGIIRSNTSNV